jgi:CheY-like chemotaxis protein
MHMPRILVIDDIPAVRATWRDILEEAGHDVLEAANGDKALSLLSQEPVELVITDIFMPGKDGIETITELRRVCPDVRIIAVSGYATDRASPYLRIAEHLGADAALCKPVKAEELVTTVMRTLEGISERSAGAAGRPRTHPV